MIGVRSLGFASCVWSSASLFAIPGSPAVFARQKSFGRDSKLANHGAVAF